MADTDRVADMSKGELRRFIQEAVQDSIQEVLWYLEQFEPDPDAGLELRPEFVEELRARIARHEAGRSTTRTVDEVRRELGIDVPGGIAIKAVLFKPGDLVPVPGQYEIVGPRGGDQGGIERTVVTGEPFPPTPEPGQRYRIVDRTRTQGRKK